MSPVGFEPTISAGERPQTYALDRAATGTGVIRIIPNKNTLYGNMERILYFTAFVLILAILFEMVDYQSI